ncbi:hypothetical protein Pint_00629 [Pistacia integerrima]|uniref:Uncharacterized protein n=1 Tax=Pistacia integerrima TaxID=434235 RepID=A0ACC0ZKZ4_9ROSI|nr:hypothetical protein Pint_00629 [Pistacia integerrima]
MEEKPFPAWSWSVEQCLKEYNVKIDKGLSSYEVEKQRQRYGWNELAKEKGKPLWQLVLDQFDDTLVKILLVAAFISFILAYLHGSESGESGFEAYVEPFVIVLILVLNAIVGVWQESNAEKALEALKEMQCESGKVLRDGYLVPDLPAKELVPGDIVELRVGDKVPADMRIAALKTSTLRVEQSSLTGEAMPILKGTSPVFLDDCELQAKENMVFAGTTVVNGSCVCIVISTGTTYDPKDGGIVDWTCYNMDANLQAMAEICAVCNDAGIHCDGRLFRATGLPTEAALKVLVEKMGVPDVKVRNKIRDIQLAANYLIDHNTVKLGCCEWWTKRSKRIATLEFDRIRKSMSVIVREPTGHNRLLVKGAVESLLERSSHVQLADGSLIPIDEPCRQLLLTRNLEMSSKGLRCLGLAYKDELGEFSDYYAENHPAHKKLLDPACYSAIESDLVFVGVVGLRDPPRDEVDKAIEDCRAAGIKVMVITGDNKSTAEAICQEIKLFSGGEDLRGRSFTGKEFMALSPTQQVEILSKPGGKVAKEASDMVLADDNFSTIVSAIAEGRSIYNNMKAFIRYMISSNVGEVISIFLTAALGIPECMIPVQLLWVNLVTDGPPATALGFNPPDVDIMRKPPRRSDDALINSWVLLRYLVIGSYVGIATVGIFILWYTQGSLMGISLVDDGHTLVSLSQLRNWGECPTWSNFTVSPYMVGGGRAITFSNPCDYFTVGKVKAMTLSLSVLVAIEMFNSLNAVSEDNSLLTMPPWRNPWLLVAMSFSFGLHCLILYVPLLADVFGIVPLSLNEWFLVILVSAPVILIDELLKFVGRSRRRGAKKEKTS